VSAARTPLLDFPATSILLPSDVAMMRRKNMNNTVPKESIVKAEEESPPVAVFKNSLRQWQARWKARQTAIPAEPGVLAEEGQGQAEERSSDRRSGAHGTGPEVPPR
jgi:hypothetical protein